MPVMSVGFAGFSARVTDPIQMQTLAQLGDLARQPEHDNIGSGPCPIAERAVAHVVGKLVSK
jgi:hypothetical protein